MRIGVMSDSHGDEDAVKKAVQSAGNVDIWLHAGDYYHDVNFIRKNHITKIVSVAGNCAGIGIKCPEEEFVQCAGKEIWICHGHRYGVKSSTRELEWMAKTYEVDIAVYGHSHIPEMHWEDELLILNPGSVSRPRFKNPTFAIIEIDDWGNIKPEIIELV